MFHDTLIDHAGHNVNIDIRGASGSVALDCDDCNELLILEWSPNVQD
jgi:hypothetical protein